MCAGFMGRPLRIQFEGACYHVANRGKDDRAIFGSAAAAGVFVQCLHETCREAGWRLHAFSLLPTEFHIILTTPRGNLVEGMHRLQAMCAVRLGNRGAGARPIFAGRYRSRLLEPGGELARWVAEIHLAPVRAGVIELGQLHAFRWSSYRLLMRKNRPSYLDSRVWLPAWPELRDSQDGWRRYRDRLERLLAADDGIRARLAGPVGGRRGPARPRPREGSAAAKAASVAVSGRELAELREPRWIEAMDRLLMAEGRTTAEALRAPKGAPWKVALAAAMRRETTVTHAWLARALGMGTGNMVSVYLGRWRRRCAEHNPDRDSL